MDVTIVFIFMTFKIELLNISRVLLHPLQPLQNNQIHAIFSVLGPSNNEATLITIPVTVSLTKFW